MTGISKTPLLIFVVFAQFLALTAKFWQGERPPKRKELTINQSKTTLLRSRKLKGLVFLSPENGAVQIRVGLELADCYISNSKTS